MRSSEEGPPVYSVRLSEPAAVQIEVEHARQREDFGPDAADAWEDALMDAIGSLATFPQRCAVAPENHLFQRVSLGEALRLFIYRRTRSGPVWRVLFSVREATADPPTVWVQHIRHGARAPMMEWPTGEEE